MPRKQRPIDLVTMGHLRSHGCRGLLVYCTSIECNHPARVNADWLPDDAVLLDLDSRFVCTKCGLIGADVRPDWERETAWAARMPAGPSMAKQSTSDLEVVDSSGLTDADWAEINRLK